LKDTLKNGLDDVKGLINQIGKDRADLYNALKSVHTIISTPRKTNQNVLQMWITLAAHEKIPMRKEEEE
jgi:hypothetical protein